MAFKTSKVHIFNMTCWISRPRYQNWQSFASLSDVSPGHVYFELLFQYLQILISNKLVFVPSCFPTAFPMLFLFFPISIPCDKQSCSPHAFRLCARLLQTECYSDIRFLFEQSLRHNVIILTPSYPHRFHRASFGFYAGWVSWRKVRPACGSTFGW